MAKTQHFTNVQAGLPIYVLLLSETLAQLSVCTRQSAFLLNQSKRKMKSGLLADLLALHKTRRKVETIHT